MKDERYKTWIIGHVHTEGGRGGESPAALDHSDLIKMARKSVILVEDTLSSPYLGEPMISAFEEILKLNPEMQIEIIVGPEADKESVSYYKKLGAKISTLDFWPIDHFTIVDGMHVRLEMPHHPRDPKTIQDIYLNYNFMTTYNNLLDDFRRQATPIQ